MKDLSRNTSIKLIQVFYAFFTLCFLISCHHTTETATDSPYPISNDAFKVETIAGGFTIPYGLAIVGEDEYFITDRVGKLLHFKDGRLTELHGVPEVLAFVDPGIPAILHGGLMDVSLHPHYPAVPWLYIAYLSIEGLAQVARIQMVDNEVASVETIFTTRTKGYYGNGMRMVWEDEKHFFLNIGGSTLSTNTRPILITQDLKEDWGKIHRLNDDGSIPSDNPVFKGMIQPSTIWSYGHRDSQGLCYDADHKKLFGVEHGPKGGDEFNVIVAGGNYGWPLFTFGINYDGAQVSTITQEEAKGTTVLPEHYWTVPTLDGGQSIAPACLLKVQGSNITEWNDHFLIGSLAFKRLMKYNRDTDETYGLMIEGRVRTIKQLPGGDIIALVERSEPGQSDGRMIKISKPK